MNWVRWMRREVTEKTQAFFFECKQCRVWDLLVAALGLAYLFATNITVVTFPKQVEAAIAFKKYGVMAGIAFFSMLLLFSLWRNRSYVLGAPVKAWIGFGIALPVLFFLFRSNLALNSHGLYYAQMASDFWWIDYPGEQAVLLKRVFLPALAYMLGFHEGTYVYFWFGLYALAVWAVVRWLSSRGLSLLECVSLAGSSMLGITLCLPGYGDIMVLVMALYAFQNPLRRWEKLALFVLALSVHEVCAVLCFAGLLLISDKQQRREWLFALVVGVMIDVCAQVLVRQLDQGQRCGQTVIVGGMHAWDWVKQRPLGTILGVLCTYKLYWVLAIEAFRKPAWRWHGIFLLLPLPFIVLASDTPRIVQFSSLAFLVLAAEVLPRYSPKIRLSVAAINLALPGFYISANCPLIFSHGLYSYYMQVLNAMGIHFGRFLD